MQTITAANATAAQAAMPAAGSAFDLFSARPDAPAIPEPLEAALRDKAVAVSSEFVDHYRRALGNLLMTLRADLESRATADWDRLSQQAQHRLEEIEQRFRTYWGQEQERRQREDRQFAARLEEAHRLFETVQEQIHSVDQMLRQQVTTERERLLAAMREEVQQLTDESRQQIGLQLQRQAGLNAEFQSRVDQVRESHEHVKALVKILPNVIQQRTREALVPVVQELRTRLEGDFSAEMDKRLQQLQQRSTEISENLQNELRRKGIEQLDRREAELLDHVGVRLEEVRSAAALVRDLAAQAAAGLDQKAAALWTEFSTRIEARAVEIQQEAAARVEDRVAQVRQAAETAIGRMTAQSWNNMQRSMEARFQHQQDSLDQMAGALRAESVERAVDLQSLFTEKQSALEEWLRQSVVSVVEQARGGAYPRELKKIGPEPLGLPGQDALGLKKIVQDAVLEALQQAGRRDLTAQEGRHEQ